MRRKRTTTTMGMTRREARTREMMATRERRTGGGKTLSRRRRFRSIRPWKEALPLRRWDFSTLYHSLLPVSTVNANDVDHKLLFRV